MSIHFSNLLSNKMHFKHLLLICGNLHKRMKSIRYLYSKAALGVDSFIISKKKIKSHFKHIEDNFKAKMINFTLPDSSSLIFTEDLKHMIYLTEENADDLSLVKEMMVKFAKQTKDLRFGSFVFGPVAMRMYYHLNKPKEALEAFMTLDKDGFFDQLSSYQILMDLLFENNMCSEVIDVFEIVKQRKLSKYPKNCVVLVLGACYKLGISHNKGGPATGKCAGFSALWYYSDQQYNNTVAYEYAKNLWSELIQVGHQPMRRAGTFAAALAIQQNEPHIALEILTSLNKQTYVTVRNLKISALADLGRLEDTLPLFSMSLDSEKKQNTFYEEVILKIKEAISKSGKSELVQEFQRIEQKLRNLGQISNMKLSEALCSEIQPVLIQTNRANSKYKTLYKKRPGLKDML